MLLANGSCIRRNAPNKRRNGHGIECKTSALAECLSMRLRHAYHMTCRDRNSKYPSPSRIEAIRTEPSPKDVSLVGCLGDANRSACLGVSFSSFGDFVHLSYYIIPMSVRMITDCIHDSFKTVLLSCNSAAVLALRTKWWLRTQT